MTILIVARGESPGGQAAGNLIHDGSFADGVAGWYPVTVASSVTYDDGTSAVTDGTGALVLTKSGAVAQMRYQPGGAPAIPTQGNTALDIALMALSPGTAGLSVSLRFFSDEAATDQVGLANAISSTPVGTSWTPVIARGVAVPGTAAYVRIEVEKNSAAASVTVDDIYVGAPLYPVTEVDAFPADRVLNGTFADGIDGWIGWWTTETLEHEAGALSVTTPGGGAEQGAIYPPNADLIVVPGETLRLTVALSGSGTVKAAMYYTGAAQDDLWSGTLGGTPTLVSEDFTVPAGAVRAGILIATTADEATTFVIDDVTLGPQP